MAAVSTYAEFLATRRRGITDSGRAIDPADVHPSLFDFQRSLTSWATRKGRAALWADTGLGKAQPVDEPVITPQGWRPIGDLAVGDEVIGVDGAPTRVIGVFPQGSRPIVSVVFTDGARVRCDTEHMWSVASDLQLSRGSGWRTKTVADLLAAGLKEPCGRYRWRVPIVAAVQHPTAELAIEPYVMGVLLGDGSFRRPNVEFCAADEEIAALVKNRLPCLLTLTIDRRNERIPNYRIALAGGAGTRRTNPYLHALIDWGLQGHLAHEKFIPAEYLAADNPQRLDLLRGLMDTDGYVARDGTIQFGSSSPALADGVVALVRSLGGIARRSVKTPTYTHAAERRTGRQHHVLTLAMPLGMVPFLLTRKAERCSDRFYVPQRKITAIEPAGSAPSVCIAVAHPSQLYVTTDYVVTHNTRMQVEWARLSAHKTLILAPLAVAQQTIREAAELGVEIAYARRQSEATGRISISNYERLDRFDPSAFGAVVLDESSILKSFSGVIKRALVEGFAHTPWRLACTATPAPNDLEELCNHAHFLGVATPAEMRSTFFIADSRGEFMRYRLKRHARTAFYRWLASWATALRHPSDLGFEDGAFRLPPLRVLPRWVEADVRPDDRLFLLDVKGVKEASAVRRATAPARVAATCEVIEAEPSEQWLVWCGLNDEGRAIGGQIDGAVVVEGSQSAEQKSEALLAFAAGEIRVLVTKASIAGFGMNFQRCARMAFCGLGYSYEEYYQAIRRCWRFGQTRPVDAWVVLSEAERAIYDLVAAKEAAAAELSSGLVAETREYSQAELFAGTSAADSYEPRQPARVPDWMGVA